MTTLFYFTYYPPVKVMLILTFTFFAVKNCGGLRQYRTVKIISARADKSCKQGAVEHTRAVLMVTDSGPHAPKIAALGDSYSWHNTHCRVLLIKRRQRWLPSLQLYTLKPPQIIARTASTANVLYSRLNRDAQLRLAVRKWDCGN